MNDLNPAQRAALDRILKVPYWPRGGYFSSHSARLFMADLVAMSQPGQQLLDLGCGRSAHYKPFVESLGLAWHGVDFYPCEQVNAKNYRLAEPTRIPFETGRFDIVMTFHVVEHFTDPEAMFGEVSRVLKPGGVFGGACAFWEREHESYFHMTVRGVRAILERHGVVVQSITPSRHSGLILSGQRFFGGVGQIDSSSRRAWLRSLVLCNLNWLPFGLFSLLEWVRRHAFGRYYRASDDCCTIYFYARKP